MSRKKTKEDFLIQVKNIHGEKYDYSKVDYINNNTKVCIVCPEHGEFWQTPHSHLSGCGCPKCSYVNRGKDKIKSTENFIKEARLKHGDKYDYSKVNYINSETKVCIICPKHGEFWQTPTAHLISTHACPICYSEIRGKGLRLNNSIIIERLINASLDDYIYDKSSYVNNRTKICITCKKHGDFFVNPATLLYYPIICPQCKQETKLLTKKILNEKKEIIKNDIKIAKQKVFIDKAKEKHGDKYDYSKVNYINSTTKVCIICPEHGEFWQQPNNHLRGCGCPKCSKEFVRKHLAMSQSSFIERSTILHKGKYDYSKVKYINNNTKVCIICPKHGEFWQTPAMHLNEGQGCPLCGTLSSKGELELFEFIKTIYNGKIIQRAHDIIGKKELDIYIPDKQIAFEFNGLRWHCEIFSNDKYKHLVKTIECQKNGIKLIQIFEDEWNFKKEICKNKIKHILGCNDSSTSKIMARKTIVKEISHKESYDFLEKYHIQGANKSTIHIGCFFNEELIAVMNFTKQYKESDKWELTRFVSNYNYICQGVGGKLFNYFINKYKPSEIKSFADRRWTTDNKNNIYIKLGFNFICYTEPDYKYVDSNYFRKRIHKFNFRKQILHKKYNLPLTMTESEMVKKLKYYKIWDCGLIKYKWVNNNK